jgi:hypothetical protein
MSWPPAAPWTWPSAISPATQAPSARLSTSASRREVRRWGSRPGGGDRGGRPPQGRAGAPRRHRPGHRWLPELRHRQHRRRHRAHPARLRRHAVRPHLRDGRLQRPAGRRGAWDLRALRHRRGVPRSRSFSTPATTSPRRCSPHSTTSARRWSAATTAFRSRRRRRSTSTRVHVSATSHNQTVELSRVAGAAACTGKPGWYFDPPPASTMSPPRIVLCPQSCTEVQSAQAAHVDLVFGCATRVIE